LIVEDSEDDALLMARELRGGYDLAFERVDTPEAMREALDRQAWDIVITDYAMPRFSALEALKILRETDPDTPCIVVSGTFGEDVAVEIMRAGAQDYFMKSNLGRLAPAVERELREARSRRERDQAKEALRASEENYRTIFEATNDAIFVYDMTTGTILDANQKMCEMYGVTREEVRQLQVADFSSGEPGYTQEEAHRQIAKAIEEGANVFEWHAKKKSGEFFWVEMSLNRTVLAGRERVLAVVRDITDRKRAEEVLKERNMELLQSNEELNDFAYVISHDLKEPLRGIHNFSSFLKEDYRDILDAEGVEKLETLAHLSQRMEVLIDAVLQYSRIGREPLEIEETDLNGVMSEVLDSLGGALDETGVKARIPRPLPTIPCHRVRVTELFQNLVANAIKYNDKPAKWVEIGFIEDPEHEEDSTTKEATAHERGYTFYVRDNGIGIRKTHLDVVFRIFKRLHARDTFGSGVGVGLTIAKKIVERHGGRIWVDSTFGEGTTFFFTLRGEHP
jgi:PAS domain S-box-containing protein